MLLTVSALRSLPLRGPTFLLYLSPSLSITCLPGRLQSVANAYQSRKHKMLLHVWADVRLLQGIDRSQEDAVNLISF